MEQDLDIIEELKIIKDLLDNFYKNVKINLDNVELLYNASDNVEKILLLTNSENYEGTPTLLEVMNLDDSESGGPKVLATLYNATESFSIVNYTTDSTEIEIPYWIMSVDYRMKIRLLFSMLRAKTKNN